jgi:hypothetical protein
MRSHDVNIIVDVLLIPGLEMYFTTGQPHACMPYTALQGVINFGCSTLVSKSTHARIENFIRGAEDRKLEKGEWRSVRGCSLAKEQAAV